MDDRLTWTQYLRQYALPLLMIAAVITVLLSEGADVWREFGRWRLERADVTEWLEYHSVEFVRELPEARGGLGALQMRSTVTVHRDVRLSFDDTLRCEPDGNDRIEMEYVSANPPTAAFSSPRGPERVTPWRYNADYPRDPNAVCVVRSNIMATVGDVSKVITIETAPFTPATGDYSGGP